MIPTLPTSYFGSIAYFRYVAQFDKIKIEAKEHFPKQTYRNRCDIVGGDGILSLSIPVTKPNGSKTHTEDILLSDDENWRVRHWRAISSAYKSAPFFDYYGIEVEDLLQSKSNNFLDFNTRITTRIIQWLDLEVEIEKTTAFSSITSQDPRIELVHKSKFQEKITAPYIQVFPGRKNYKEALSILDAVFCEGPLARNLILNP